jgi:hypothetical protein
VTDVGMLVSLVAVGVACWVRSRTLSPVTLGRDQLLGRLWLPMAVGMVIGRVASLGATGSLSGTSVGTFILVRNGVWFWPGLMAAAATAAIAARHEGVSTWRRLAELSCVGLVGYGTYEAACIVRDGCFGPASPIGLVPPDLSRPVLPLGLAVGALAVAGGVLLGRWWTLRARTVVLSALLLVAVLRSTAWFGLPRATGTANLDQSVNLGVMTITAAILCGIGLSHRRRIAEIESHLGRSSAEGA